VLTKVCNGLQKQVKAIILLWEYFIVLSWQDNACFTLSQYHIILPKHISGPFLPAESCS